MIGGEKGEEKKMKSTELRLGNYVTGFQNTIRKVSGILDDGQVYTSDIVNGEFTIESDNDLQGISLSPDILLKVGFIYEAGLYSIVTTTCHYINLRHLENGLFRIDSLVDLEYIHQLQNLFFCLCGKELEINLV